MLHYSSELIYARRLLGFCFLLLTLITFWWLHNKFSKCFGKWILFGWTIPQLMLCCILVCNGQKDRYWQISPSRWNVSRIPSKALPAVLCSEHHSWDEDQSNLHASVNFYFPIIKFFKNISPNKLPDKVNILRAIGIFKLCQCFQSSFSFDIRQTDLKIITGIQNCNQRIQK